MPAEGTLPPAAAGITNRLRFACCALLSALLLPACSQGPEPHVLAAETAPDGSHIALVRLITCDGGWCESLWVGPAPDSASRLATLPRGAERCDDIAWTRDGSRVAFLVNGVQLRLYNAQSHAPAGLIDLVPNDATPPARIARGITFSDNGAAITFDDCPRDRSGCRPGLVAVR